jgi:predicted chitinase
MLKRWASSHPKALKSRAFRIVADFGIERGLNLAQTLHILSDFDVRDADQYDIDEDVVEQLYRAYEMVYDAWVPNNPDAYNQSASHYWYERPGQINEIDDDLFGQDTTIDKIHDAYGRIADYGNDGYEILDFLGGAYNQLSDKYDSGGDIDDIVARSNAVERKQLLLDLEYIADRCDEHYGNVNEADIADIAEPPERPRKTKTKTTPDINLNPFQSQPDQPLTNPNAPTGSNNNPVNIRRVDQRTTLNKTAGITPTGDMKNMLGRMRNVSIDPNLPDYPDQQPNTLPSIDVNTSNLPAVAGQALRVAGVQSPEFHQVANLPGNMAAQIRQLGRALFGSLTMTPTNRIYMIANLGGQGPNSTQEVSAVANFLKQRGEDRGPGEIDFDAIMPGYRAETRMFTAAGIRWMLVKDFAGQYIYSWPEEDSADATPRLDEYEVDEGALDWAKKAAAATAIGAAGVGMFGTGQPNAPVQQPAQVAAPVAKSAQPTAQHIEHMQKSLSRPNAQLLITVARKHGLEGDELAQFLAQTAHESAGFGIAGMKEKPQPGKKNYFAKYKRNAGNKSVIDAKKFFGRGFVQLTGKYNYAEASKYLYMNHLVKTPDALLRDPTLAADPVLAAEIAVWFWKRFVQPNVNNFTDTASVTKKINPAMRGFDDRKNKFAALKQIMNK